MQWHPRPHSSRPAPGREPDSLAARVRPPARRDPRRPAEPGAELAEVALAEQLGVSRGPMREAIGRLASEGLVTVRPRRGAVVSSLSKEEFLEPVPGARGARDDGGQASRSRGSARGRRRARGAGRRGWPRTPSGPGRASSSRRTPLSTSASSRRRGTRSCSSSYRQLLDQLGRYRLRSLRLRGNLERSVAEHAAILRAAKRGRRRPGSAPDVGAHPRAAAQPQGLERRGASPPRCGHRDRVRRQPEQPRAADRTRLRHADAARPVRDGRGVRLRLGLGRRLALLEAALRADLAALGDLPAHVARAARHRRAWSPRRATRCTSRSSGRRST